MRVLVPVVVMEIMFVPVVVMVVAMIVVAMVMVVVIATMLVLVTVYSGGGNSDHAQSRIPKVVVNGRLSTTVR